MKQRVDRQRNDGIETFYLSCSGWRNGNTGNETASKAELLNKFIEYRKFLHDSISSPQLSSDTEEPLKKNKNKRKTRTSQGVRGSARAGKRVERQGRCMISSASDAAACIRGAESEREALLCCTASQRWPCG